MNQALQTTATTSDEQALQRHHDVEDLNGLYNEADSADQLIFAEMRSNLLLVAGEHYQKRESAFYKHIRNTKELNQEQKIRLTKNHIRKICQGYSNNIMAMAPGVGFSPKDEKSNHDQKVAELHRAVWRDAFERYNLDDLMDDWCDNFVQIGEVATKIFFDPAKGYLKGYEPILNSFGEPQIGMDGQPEMDESRPIYSGEFVFEEIYGFNLLRPAECRDLRQAEWLGIRKMVSKADLLLRFADPEKQEMIQDGVDETYQVFDAAYGGHYKSKNQVLVREYFFRPCLKYPKGYFYITTKEGILAEGELPGGIFPIVVQVFDKIQTTPRGRSPVKQMRPYQIEINRAASKIAEHQVTLGDDKILIQNGTKVSAGVSLPGVRTISYTGAAPGILNGRSGEQYVNYLTSQISELYMVMSLAEDTETKQSGNLDPYVLLYRAARQKKPFQRYIKRFEKFLIEVVKVYLKLAKVHLDDDALIYAMGTSEQVNIPEFKKLPDTCFEVVIEAQADDIETKLGKQIVINHALQYIGNQLKPDDIGKIMRASPIADFDESFDDLTMDYDSTTNDILALDRGEKPPVNEYDNHIYCIKRLTSRVRKPDFKFLPPPVQMAYSQKISVHQQMQAFQVQQLQRAEQGFIPTGGGFVKCDLYVADPLKPGQQKRATFPQEALTWLAKQIETQGGMLEPLAELPQGAQVQIAERVGGGGMMPPSAPNPGGNTVPGN